jgi:hypothetical protein
MRAFWTGELVGCPLPLESSRKGIFAAIWLPKKVCLVKAGFEIAGRVARNDSERRHQCLKLLHSLI